MSTGAKLADSQSTGDFERKTSESENYRVKLELRAVRLYMAVDEEEQVAGSRGHFVTDYFVSFDHRGNSHAL